MSKVNNQMIDQIITAIGGLNNIAQNGNCMTRLRLSLHNRDLADHQAIKKIDGVMGLIESDTQLQIILGPGKAQAAKELVEKRLVENSGNQSEQPVNQDLSLDEIAKLQKQKMKSKQNASLQSFFSKFATIFTPLIPGFIAAGLLLGVATLLEQNFVVGVQDPNMTLVSIIGYTKLFSKGLFTFLGILIGYNAQQAFGGSGVNGAILASLFLLTYSATGTVGYYSGIESFFGMHIDPRGNIIGILIAAIFGAYVERFVRQFIPANLDMLLTSTITLLIMGVVTYLVIMPIGVYLFDGMSFLFKHLNSNPLGAAVLAGLFLIAVMFGIHQGFVPVYIALVDSQGFNSLFPILAMAGAGQVGAAIALFVRAKKGSLLRKQVSGAIIPGFLGIGEPLIYGVTLPRIKPFITACIGGSAGGFFIGLIAMLGIPMGLNSVFGPSGLVAIPFMTSDSGILPAIIIYVCGILIAYIVGFLATYFFGSKNVDLS